MNGQLVSCVTVINDDPTDVLKTIAVWTQQQYQERELIVVNNRKTRWQAVDLNLPSMERVYVVDTDKFCTIGECFQLGMSSANGSIIAPLQIGDWYAPNYLDIMTTPLLNQLSTVSVLDSFLVWSQKTGHVFIDKNAAGYQPSSIAFFRQSDLNFHNLNKNYYAGLVENSHSVKVTNPTVYCKIIRSKIIVDPVFDSTLKLLAASSTIPDSFIISAIENAQRLYS